MKKTIIFTAILLITFCSDSPQIKIEPGDRIVLAEFFTFARCVYCPYAEHALDSLLKEYGDSLAVIAYHRRALGDTLSPPYVAVRESLYNIQTSPIVVFDGLQKIQTEKPEDNYPVYKNCIISERNRKTKLRLNLESTLKGDVVSLKVNIVVIDSIKDSEHRLFIVLVEDSVFFKQVGAPDSIFYFVMRKMIPDAKGITVNLVYPDSLIEERNCLIQSNWNVNKLGVVAFVQDMETKEVIQAVVKRRIVK
ncbi:MAG: Omp28-related outer membrane protein [candidate division WOR-3 bacterium]|nr:Omp28-related outer membrane protein [candidate division WOR-3 bacterium]